VVEMSERPFRFINPEPRLALLLAAREPKALPKPIYSWAVQWAADVGSIMRSRDYMAYTGALYGTMVVVSGLLRFLPDVALLDIFIKRLGFRE